MKLATSSHSNFVSYIDSYSPPENTSAFRCKFTNKNDCNKHFYITVMAFHIPNIIN